jgi:phage portal protein BeeE
VSLFLPPRTVSRAEKAVTGPGAAAMMTLQPLWTATQADPHALMRQAQQVYLSNPWVFKAEEAISGKFASTEWHLEDQDDVEIDDAYPNEAARRCLDLFEKPQANLAVGSKLTRRELWHLVSRDMGICGSSFWMLDQEDGLAGTPLALLYINPVRMTPAEDAQGNLTGWVLDYRQAQGTGIPLRLDEVLHFKLAPPITGHFGIGMVQAAMSKVSLSRLADGHASDTLATGGRLAGLISAKSGGTIPDAVYQQLTRDLRTVADSANAAKRMTVIQGPIDFNKTAATPVEIGLLELMTQSKEDILAIWGVPLSQIGGVTPAGLNSGDTRKYDQAAMQENAVHPRLVAFWEMVQYQLVDRWQKLGVNLHLDIEEPEFDLDSPRYDLLAKSLNLPMRNSERRALIGLDPFGVPELDDEIVLPATLVVHSSAPEDQTPGPSAEALGRVPDTNAETGSAAASAAGETSGGNSTGKAAPLRQSMTRLRAHVEQTMTGRLRSAVVKFLHAQRAEIAEKVRTKGAHLASEPKDQVVWWNEKQWDDRLRTALTPHLAGVAQTVASHIHEALPTGKALPIEQTDGEDAFVERVLASVLNKGGARITNINRTTREAVQALIDQGASEGLSPAAMGDLIESATTFDEYRAEMIGQTELRLGYNDAARGSYEEVGVHSVEAIDGDGDTECADRNGEIFTLDEAAEQDDLEHPNGTLDWAPVIEEKAAKAADPLAPFTAALMAMASREQPAPIVNNYITTPAVNVEAPAKASVSKRVLRDEQGRIVGLEEIDG